MLARFVFLISGGAIVACIAACIFSVIGPSVPVESRRLVLGGLIVVLAFIFAIIVSKK